MPSPASRRPLVLVVEDDREAADLLRWILEDEGCQVLVETDAAAALETARELPLPDLVLLDLELPGAMDGRDLLAAIRADPSLSGIPVVVVSGSPDAADVYATDNVRKATVLDGLRRILDRVHGLEERGEPSVAGTEESTRAAAG